MLTFAQRLMVLKGRRSAGSLFSNLPFELIVEISESGRDDTTFNNALLHAALGTKEDMAILVGMIEKNPRLLLQKGDVKNRGGVLCKRKTIYEFLLGEGDPAGAKQIEFGFAKIPGGEDERIRQYEPYRPYIEALAKQVESSQPAFDLRPLIELIKRSSAADITAALNKDMVHKSDIRDALIKFRIAVSLKKEVGVGMHYEHYTTLMQGLKLLYDEWQTLSNNYTNYDKCRLVWCQIIGFLQRSLPAVDRFAFARAFDDAKRTVEYKYDTGSFPDAGDTDDLNLAGVGFDEAIFGFAEAGRAGGPWSYWEGARASRLDWKTHVEQKLQTCRTYAATPETNSELRDPMKRN